MKSTARSYHRIVVKFGTSVLTGGARQLSRPQMVDLARQCAELHHAGFEVVICTSGAQAVGRERLGFPHLAPTIASKQMVAAVGQSRLMLTWERFFEIYDIHVGQILLTHGDVESRHRFLNAQDVLHALIDHRIIPIINENDAVATEEIKIGDNDNLSALVAVMADADLLLILTDQQGLFTADPRQHPDAQLIEEVGVIDDAVRALAGDSRSGLGVGGMVTKLQAATVARRAGVDVIITSGQIPDVIVRAAQGESLGTRFPALSTPPENRKRWILAGAVNSGHIVVDDGAAQALRYGGRSLLPAGIAAIEGSFDRGDTVAVRTSANLEIARGLTRYSSEELARLKGIHSEDIAATLGYTYGAVAVHRNDMILLS
ncbi:MAG: glutamate 5-kinase [Anaerolineae bacterium]|nr:glutamate 5-kinase [Anaerolineae bacterium]